MDESIRKEFGFSGPLFKAEPRQVLREAPGYAPDELHKTLCDALSGWKYIRETHGDLYGVGWDRVQERLEKQIKESAIRLGA